MAATDKMPFGKGSTIDRNLMARTLTTRSGECLNRVIFNHQLRLANFRCWAKRTLWVTQNGSASVVPWPVWRSRHDVGFLCLAAVEAVELAQISYDRS
jgi:hypothetical protein